MMDDDEDDSMADLFSFGADTAPPPPNVDSAAPPIASGVTDLSFSEMDELFQDSSDDSFLRMLDEHPAPSTPTRVAGSKGAMEAMTTNDPETQDILNWLREDDTDADALLAAVADESAQKAQQKQKQQTPPPQEEHPVPPSLAPPLAPLFASLQDALESPESTKLQILEQWEQKEKCHLKDDKLRPLLWCRIICGKSVDEVTASSLADSFQAFVNDSDDNDATTTNNNNAALESWIRSESAKLAPRIVRTHPNGISVNSAEGALRSILLYHYHSNHTSHSDIDQKNTLAQPDPLLPPVICAVLSAGVPTSATPVLMSHIVPSFMPFVALTPEERWEASKLLHSQFYLLACYHLPMLVYHLDRYVPGWYWPQLDPQTRGEEKENCATHRGRHLRDQGVLPPSWLMTHLVGECGGTFLDPNRLLQLLDLVFTNENNSLRFFLVLAVLEQHSDSWLELIGDALMHSLRQHLQDSTALTMEEWAARARAMKQATPESVVNRLRNAEDEAVREALKERQKRAEAALKARLEAEAATHREAQERKAEEARTRLTRARLVAYYRRYSPTKEGNIDKIMEVYKDNFEELDRKLKKKYGVGFNPALNPVKKITITQAANESMKKTMQSVNDGIKRMALTSTAPPRPGNPLDEHEDTDEIRKKEHRVSVNVKVAETLPYVCMTREQANDIRRVCLQKDLPMPLRFYLVDSRSDEVAERQGRFPTAARLSPETLLNPELLQEQEDSFEAVRGSFHICVMGEGHAAIPVLYNQKLTPALEEYMHGDESRTNNCALFFVKRGFPFVSVLEGGFVAAHAWLFREGPKKGFDVTALLVDYNPEVSLFGQMEKIRREQVGYKAQRALHSLLEASIPEIGRGKSIAESTLTDETEASKAEKAETAVKPQTKSSEDATAHGISSFFGRRQQQVAADKQLEREKNDGGATDEATSASPAGTAEATAQNRFAKWRQAAASAINAADEVAQPAPPVEQQKQPAPPAPGNRFGGFGLRRGTSHEDSSDNAANSKPQPILRRNPFARFGGGAGAAARTAAPPGSETAKVAMTTASSAFGGLMKVATTAKPTFGRGNLTEPGSNSAKSQQNGSGPTIVRLPPRPDEVTDEDSLAFDGANHQGMKKVEPALRTV